MDNNATIEMQCGWASCTVQVTAEELKTKNFVPCPNCPEGGVDLMHARRHSDGF
ncbi:hypothetical protein [Streptomyces sp. NPDC058869]|uniref:hypothetical protein n=1 Tax=Streptomyces sp. NPDC058869 TaxID=3346659 RepID=UPI0036991724